MIDLAPQPNDDPRPWEQPGAVRRDSAPHRGKLLEALADVACLIGILSCATFVPVLVAFPLGVWTWAAARGDLAEMRAGQMDRNGELQTRRAEATAAAAVAICLCVLTAGSLLLVSWLFRVR